MGGTPAQIVLGDRIYHGRVAGALCSVCHGQRGRGTPKGPRLADSVWLHIDGSYEAILRVVATGIPTARVHTGTMLVRGGAELSDGQLRAVAAYVYTLAHPVR